MLRRATLWADGVAYPLVDLISSNAGCARLSIAYAVSVQGYIVGIGRRMVTGEDHAFLLTPIPEPTAAGRRAENGRGLFIAVQLRAGQGAC